MSNASAATRTSGRHRRRPCARTAKSSRGWANCAATAPLRRHRARRPRPQQGAEPTTAIPVQRPHGGRPAEKTAEPTTAITAQPQQDPEATEKLTAQKATEEETRRRGGGVSAAELLRREGRGR